MRARKFNAIASSGAYDIAGFRLRRHHLRDDAPTDAVTICRDVCGVQAQVMSAAYLQLWARNHAITQAEIESALWQSRTLVKTSLMRQTLHLIPADEFALYIAAVRSSRVAAVLRIMARFGITREEADDLSALIMDALSAGPLGRAEITAAVQPRVSRRVRAWMGKVWSIVRIPVAEGWVCYGPGEGNQVKFIRVDQWLPKMKPVAEAAAQHALFRKYLRAYGPATISDFSHWSGIAMKDARQVCELVKDELREVTVDGETRMVVRGDLAALTSRSRGTGVVNLLPNFDAYLLAHADKDHLIEARHYKQVYRNQWWISPVILLDGRVVGTWSYKFHGRKMTVEIDAFEKFPRPIRCSVEQEAASLGSWFRKEVEIRMD